MICLQLTLESILLWAAFVAETRGCLMVCAFILNYTDNARSDEHSRTLMYSILEYKLTSL